MRVHSRANSTDGPCSILDLAPARGVPAATHALAAHARAAHARAVLAWAVLAWAAGGHVLGWRATPLAAQTVSPPVAEYQEKARSSFQLINGSIFPLAVVLEVKGFDITERGDLIEAPLDTARLRVKLSATSFRIPPRSTYTVFYEATGDNVPAWFQIMAALSGARTDNGINLRILLPHVVYLNQKAPLRRESVVVHRFEVDPAEGKARALLENTSAELGRVLELAFDSPAGDSRSGGFPLLPRRRRWVELDWREPAPPNRLVVRTAKFTLDTSLVAAPPAMQMADSTGSKDAPPSGASPGR